MGDREMLRSILQDEGLKIREITLFHATHKWAIEECKRETKAATHENLRLVLGDLLFLLRLPTIDQYSFSQEAARSGLLTTQESHDIFLGYKSDLIATFPFVPR